MTRQLRCWKCRKPVSTPVPEETVVRAVLECQECVDAVDHEIEERHRWEKVMRSLVREWRQFGCDREAGELSEIVDRMTGAP